MPRPPFRAMPACPPQLATAKNSAGRRSAPAAVKLVMSVAVAVAVVAVVSRLPRVSGAAASFRASNSKNPWMLVPSPKIVEAPPTADHARIPPGDELVLCVAADAPDVDDDRRGADVAARTFVVQMELEFGSSVRVSRSSNAASDGIDAVVTGCQIPRTNSSRAPVHMFVLAPLPHCGSSPSGEARGAHDCANKADPDGIDDLRVFAQHVGEDGVASMYSVRTSFADVPPGGESNPTFAGDGAPRVLAVLRAHCGAGLFHALQTLLQVLRSASWDSSCRSFDVHLPPASPGGSQANSPLPQDGGSDAHPEGGAPEGGVRPARVVLIPFPVVIQDWPDVPHRAVMVDVSRGKVPTVRELHALCDMLGEVKINELQLYMEVGFAYPGHAAAWSGTGVLDGAELANVVGHCRSRFVTVIPNQQSLGHAHRWLTKPEYRHLAELPADKQFLAHPFTWRSREPYGFAPNPTTLAFLNDIYGGLLPAFDSDAPHHHHAEWERDAQRRADPPGDDLAGDNNAAHRNASSIYAGGPFLHVGLDEPVDFCVGASHDACVKHPGGRSGMFVDFLRNVSELVRNEYGRTTMYWGDFALDNVRLRDLPKNAIMMVWGYQAFHNFRQPAQSLSNERIPFYLCPGTSSWNGVAPRASNALRNIANAVHVAVTHGARGVMICDWGDNGHMQPAPSSWLGFVVGAALTWNAQESKTDLSPPFGAWEERMTRHVFKDCAGIVAPAYFHFSMIQEVAMRASRSEDQSLLFKVMVPEIRTLPTDKELRAALAAISEVSDLLVAYQLPEGLTREALLMVNRTVPRIHLEHSRMQRSDAQVLTQELKWIEEFFRVAVSVGLAVTEPPLVPNPELVSEVAQGPAMDSLKAAIDSRGIVDVHLLASKLRHALPPPASPLPLHRTASASTGLESSQSSSVHAEDSSGPESRVTTDPPPSKPDEGLTRQSQASDSNLLEAASPSGWQVAVLRRSKGIRDAAKDIDGVARSLAAVWNARSQLGSGLSDAQLRLHHTANLLRLRATEVEAEDVNVLAGAVVSAESIRQAAESGPKPRRLSTDPSQLAGKLKASGRSHEADESERAKRRGGEL